MWASATKLILVFVGLVTLSVSGCCSVRRVERMPDCGVIAMPADTNAWPLRYRDKADELMRQHFPGGYVIESEEEVVVGQQTHVSGDHTDSVVETCGPVRVKTGSHAATVTTSDVTEWRIRYRRR